MNRIIFRSYKKAFPELETIIMKSNKRIPRNPTAIRVWDINSLKDKVSREDEERRCDHINIQELWKVSEDKVITKIDKSEYPPGRLIKLDSNNLKSIDYIVLLDYYFSRWEHKLSDFGPLPFSKILPGDIEITEDFSIDIYESPSHYKTRSKCNKFLDKSLFYMWEYGFIN